MILQVYKAVDTHNQHGSIYLGDLSERTCVVKPDKCGPDPQVTVLLWLKFIRCGIGEEEGLLSSYGTHPSPGFSFGCSGTTLR